MAHPRDDHLQEKGASLRAGLKQSTRPDPLRVAGEDARDEAARAQALPRIVHGEGRRLADWVRANARTLPDLLHGVGGVLFRGFEVGGVDGFREVCLGCIDDLMPYQERSTPRSELGDRIYTSTAYPDDQTILLHNEFSYAQAWPLRICFHALKPSEGGGETPIADSRRIYLNIPPHVRDPFVRKGVMYVRRYGHGLDLSWQETFCTEDKAEVAAYCRRNAISFTWDGDRLTTRQVRPAVARHPITGETLWFNQAHLFHRSALPPDVREAMERVLNDDFPREALYGDGTPIEPAALALIGAAFDEAKVVFRWEKDDVLLLDNMLVCHGRNPVQGERKVLVAMGESVSRDETTAVAGPR
ncbi:TauD/TfdA family dioxygenase [Kribbella yunnanensis]|uniref:TauD/TfdA family dioxygenase n=1 Tax=Kribbella yunnanensis TaxID=190194 RepID=A0ABN2HPW7_9ACTN